MRNLVAILFILTVVQCSRKQTVTLASTTKQLFFDGHIEKSDAGLIEFYKHSKYLSFVPREGYTIYPPLSALGQEGPDERNTFHFTTHPYLSFPFREGELLIIVRKSQGKKVYDPPLLKLAFDTKEQSELALQELTDRFSKLSTMKRFITNEDTKKAAFTDENVKPYYGIELTQYMGDALTKGYVIWFFLGNDLRTLRD
jgi:hypothetical protein